MYQNILTATIRFLIYMSHGLCTLHAVDSTISRNAIYVSDKDLGHIERSTTLDTNYSLHTIFYSSPENPNDNTERSSLGQIDGDNQSSDSIDMSTKDHNKCVTEGMSEEIDENKLDGIRSGDESFTKNISQSSIPMSSKNENDTSEDERQDTVDALQNMQKSND